MEYCITIVKTNVSTSYPLAQQEQAFEYMRNLAAQGIAHFVEFV